MLHKEGLFIRAYEYSAFLFVKHIKEYQTTKKYYKTYKIKKKMIFKNLSGWWWNYVYLSGGINKFVLKKKYI